MRHLLDPEDRGVRRAREQRRKRTRPRRGERVEADGGNPADSEDPPSTQKRSNLTERETAHMRAERPDRGGLPSKSQQGTVVETGKVRNREGEMPSAAEPAGNLGQGQRAGLEMLEALVAEHQGEGLIRPRQPSPCHIHQLANAAAPRSRCHLACSVRGQDHGVNRVSLLARLIGARFHLTSVVPVLVLLVVFKLSVSDGGRHAPTLTLAETAICLLVSTLAATGTLEVSRLGVAMLVATGAAAFSTVWS